MHQVRHQIFLYAVKIFLYSVQIFFTRYYILGNECLVADLQAKGETISDKVKTQMWTDLLELDTIYFHLPLNTQVSTIITIIIIIVCETGL